jgi:hypothetical protein
MPGIRPLHLWFAALLLACAAHPLRAQDDLTFQGVPWGGDPARTAAALRAAGLQPDKTHAADPPDANYLSPEGLMVTALFSADNRLVGMVTEMSAPRAEVADFFARSRRDGVSRLGAPAFDEPGHLEWQRGETAFVLEVAEDGDDATLSVLYTGPGYLEEMARREPADAGYTVGAPADEAAEFPALEARWRVIGQDDTQRTSYDQATLRPQGNRVVQAWMRTDFLEPRTGPFTYDQLSSLLEIDCAQSRARTVSATFRLNGQAVHSVTDAAPWRVLEPETAAETIAAAVCSTAGRR